MKKNDVSYKNEEMNIKFNFRVALICTKDNKILLQKAMQDDYWSLIGGRVELNENTLDAIIREVKEETGVVFSKKQLKLLRVIENFFKYNGTKFHELLYIYKTVGDNKLCKMDDFKTLDKEKVINKWIPNDSLKDIDLRPEIVKTCYNSRKVEHIIIESKD